MTALMPAGAAPAARSQDDRDHASEAFATLLGLARGYEPVPAELIARHVVRVYGAAEWNVQRAALEAIERRRQSMRASELRVVGRPPGRAPLGEYTTAAGRRARRPYRTLLLQADPLGASCDCPDFLRASLGLCKHVLAVLGDLAASRGRWQKALAARCDPTLLPRLRWDPIRPLHGPGDWLDRLRWHGDSGGGTRASRIVAQHFAAGASDDRGSRLRHSFAGDPERRAALLADLARLEPRVGRRLRDPAVAALLGAESARLARQVQLRERRKDLERALRGLARPLYPYQREGVDRFLQQGRLLLADDMGLGKTAQAIAACHALWHTGLARRGLLVVPASLKHQWVREWQLFSDAPIASLDGGGAERERAYRGRRHGFLVTNYEQLLRDLDAVTAWAPDLVVLDEAQRIKNWETKTAASVKRLDVPFRLVLTGTPMENRFDELASIMDWVDDHALEPKWRLVPFHTAVADGAREVTGVRHLDTLRQRLAPSLLRRRRLEVLSQLPPRTDTVVPVEMTEAQLEEHAALDMPIAQLTSAARRRPLTQPEFLKLMMLLLTQRIVANGLAQLRFVDQWPELQHRRPTDLLLRTLSTPKLLELREIVARVAIAQQRKIVVFSQWRRMAELAGWAVSDVLAAHGQRVAFFTGRESQRRRTANIVAFHDDPGVSVLLATDAGGVGLNLQRAASCCINMDLPWNPAVLEQRIGRIWRLGQTQPIDVYNLVSEDSIEARIARLIGDKKELFQGLFDGESDAVAFERSGSFLENLQRVVGSAAATGARNGARNGAQAPAQDADGELELELDADALPAAEVDTLVDAGDEASDDSGPQAPAAGAPGGASPPSVAAPPATAAARAPSPAGTAHDCEAPSADAWLRQLAVTRTAEGGLRIEAPPAAAANLAAVFASLADLLRASASAESTAAH